MCIIYNIIHVRREQIHGGALALGRYDQSMREIKILKSLIQVRSHELERLRSCNPVIPAPAVLAMGRDREQRTTAVLSVPHQMHLASKSLANLQHEASYLACSLRSQDVIVRSGKGFDIETEKDCFANAYCHRPQSALRKMTQLSLVQAEALSIQRRLDLLHARQQVGLLAASRTAQPPALLAENRRDSLLPPPPPLAEKRKDNEHL